MPKILLIYPPLSKVERYSSDIGDSGGNQMPLGILCLASFMRAKGYEVQAIDAEARRLSADDIIEISNEFNPDFIGISSTTVAFHRAIEVAASLKERFQTPIILGGAHVSCDYSHAMSFTEFDYAVFGEGEHSLFELCEALLNEQQLIGIAGIIYRDDNGAIIKNEVRQFISNLDELPFPAYDLIPDIDLYRPRPQNYKELPVINVITSRGCPGVCTFCSKSVFGNHYRYRSAQNIFDEIQMLRKMYSVKEIYFQDETFLVNKKRIKDLFELLKQADISISWTCLGRITDVDHEFLKWMKENGCWHISFGIESGNPDILKGIKKNISLEKASQLISACKKYSIRTTGFFIIGHPNETLETIEDTIKYALSTDLDYATASINTPFPGSPQYETIEEYGTLDKTDWSQYNFWRPVFVPNGLSENILIKKHKEFYHRFFFRPRTIPIHLKIIMGKGGFRRLLSLIKAARFLFKKS